MIKRWSSFEGQQLLQENWRNFLSEESETAKSFRAQGYVTDDHWEEPEEDPQASDYPDVSHGLDSDDNEESLKQVLTPILDGEKGPEHIQTLIDVIAQIAGDEGIMLELSLKGLNSEQDRIIDSAGTALILKAIAGFNLPDAKNTALIKALNYWGRVNSVKFTAPPAAAPAVVNTTDPSDDTPQDTTAPDEPEPEPGPEPEPEQERTPLQNPDAPPMTLPVAGLGANKEEEPEEAPRFEIPPEYFDFDDEASQRRASRQMVSEPDSAEEQGWSPSQKSWVPATPENARQELIEWYGSPHGNYRRSALQLKYLEELSDGGGGLMFEDEDTEEKTYTGEWIQFERAAASPGQMVMPEYNPIIVMPSNLKSIWRRLKDFFRDAPGISNTSWHGEFESEIDPRAVENLEDVIKLMRSNVQSMRKPDDAESLQETYDRWQTIAGINQRVL